MLWMGFLSKGYWSLCHDGITALKLLLLFSWYWLKKIPALSTEKRWMQFFWILNTIYRITRIVSSRLSIVNLGIQLAENTEVQANLESIIVEERRWKQYSECLSKMIYGKVDHVTPSSIMWLWCSASCRVICCPWLLRPTKYWDDTTNHAWRTLFLCKKMRWLWIVYTD